MKVAKLVTVSLITRVIVDYGADDETILELARPKFVDKINKELNEHLEYIEDDDECPFDEEFDK
jgi:hypothetical protein